MPTVYMATIVSLLACWIQYSKEPLFHHGQKVAKVVGYWLLVIGYWLTVNG